MQLIKLNNTNYLKHFVKNTPRFLCTTTQKDPPAKTRPDETVVAPKLDENPKVFYQPPVNPVNRTINILKNDMIKVKNFIFPNKEELSDRSAKEIEDDNSKPFDRKDFLRRYKAQENKDEIDQGFPSHCDVVIIGGGGVGSSIAYWLRKNSFNSLNVVVVEKDNTYASASTTLSVGGIRQQFSLEENIQMSLYAADFMRDIKENLDEEVELNFTPHGYLMMATEEGAETLSNSSRLQNEMGAKNEILTAKQLKAKFPWLNTEGIALGCHGLEKEGWFDPYALLMGFKRTAKRLGAQYVDGEAIGFEFKNHQDIIVPGIEPGSYEGLDRLHVKMANGEVKVIKFAIAIIAAGAQSGNVAKMAKIGNGPGLLSIPLPVEPRKRYVYVFETQGENYPGLNTPLTIDPNNTYFRRDGMGGNFIGGRSPSARDEPSIENLDVDYGYFDTDVWPSLAHRVPCFESIKVKNAWAGYYEYNTFDENGIIGAHPYYINLYIATGFSGHGIQQTPAVGRAVAELILDGRYRTIDLSRLGFDRIIVDQPMFEVNIV